MNVANRKLQWMVFAVLGLSMVCVNVARTDNLLVQRVQQEKGLNLPTRGMSMTQVEHSFGAPVRKLSPRGGGRPLQPVISRWEYGNFIVYFEHDRVIHSVLNTPAGNNQHPASIN